MSHFTFSRVKVFFQQKCNFVIDFRHMFQLRHDTQYNDTWHTGTQHTNKNATDSMNDSQHYNTQDIKTQNLVSLC